MERAIEMLAIGALALLVGFAAADATRKYIATECLKAKGFDADGIHFQCQPAPSIKETT